MRAIVIATNLALDYVIVPGNTDKYGRTPIEKQWLGVGSKGGNVFRALTKLSPESVMLLGMSGAGEIGEIIEKKLKKLGTAQILRALTPDSRINIIIPPNQLLSAPAPNIDESTKAEITRLIKTTGQDGDILVITGSHPKGISPDDLLVWVKARKWRHVMVDQKGEYLRRLAEHHPQAIFKINHREYEDIMDLKLPQVIVTLGSGGAVMLKNGKPVLKIEIPLKIHEINPVGAGDVFMASLVSSLLEEEELSNEALLTAVARAAASVEHLGVSIWEEERAQQLRERLIFHQIP